MYGHDSMRSILALSKHAMFMLSSKQFQQSQVEITTILKKEVAWIRLHTTKQVTNQFQDQCKGSKRFEHRFMKQPVTFLFKRMVQSNHIHVFLINLEIKAPSGVESKAGFNHHLNSAKQVSMRFQ